MAVDNASLVSTLNHLTVTCSDGEKGYHTAADCVKNHELKTLFHSYADQRGCYVAELETEIRRLGGTPDGGGTVAGALRRGWTNLKATVTGGDDRAIISECERSEDSAKKDYEEALKAALPAEVQAIVQRQFSGIKEAHDRVRALEVATEKI